MKTLQTEVLVIGGGATGTGILRDLAMRGFKSILVEKRDLAHGTTGRYHGLLHSGGRYVVKDPQAARECIEENKILRKIMPHCIEDTGGFFVVTPWDDPDYGNRFVTGCQQAGVPVEEISVLQMLHCEPMLNSEITRCFRVPDASADSFLTAEVNIASAMAHGATALTYHEVTRLLAGPKPKGGGPRRVSGALCYDLEHDEEVTIQADCVVNASGAWAGKIAAMAGVLVQIRPGKGTMLAINHRVVNTVINRCKMPSDGDILVPAHTVAVIGTTDKQVSDPDHFGIEAWEIELMLVEGEKMLPRMREMRILRAWAGVRPLYQETGLSASRNITRAYVLLDHAERDGVEGLVTITSGKWTTYRKMAEVTVDKVCKKLKVQRECRTHLEPLPAQEKEGFHQPGARLARIEAEKNFRSLVCECELASEAEIRKAILQGNARTIDDIRRDTRLGMGPCQGGFCALRAVGILHELRKPPIEKINAALRDFLQERWKGLRAVLWGQQLRQERLDELIYVEVLNAQALPGPESSRLGPEDYKTEPPTRPLPVIQESKKYETSAPPTSGRKQAEGGAFHLDAVIIGAGLAGLTAAWRLALGGKRSRLITKGWGALYWRSGCIDVLGYLPAEDKKPVTRLAEALELLTQAKPNHPYALAGKAYLAGVIQAFQDLCSQAGYPLQGSLEKNWLLPTALGTLRPTCLAPESMIAGDATTTRPMLIVGFDGFLDFYPALVAANLQAQGINAQAISLDIPSLREAKNLTSRVLGLRFDDAQFRNEVAQLLHTSQRRSLLLQPDLRIGFPAVLGWNQPREAWKDMQERAGFSIFEIPGLPPSLPGMRLQQILVRAIEQAGGSVFEGMQVCAADLDGAVVETAWSEASARRKPHRANQFVLATGGFLGGGITAGQDGLLKENIFHLPLETPGRPNEWFQTSFLADAGHPIFRAGVRTNTHFQPVDAQGKPVYTNLSVVGSLIAGCDAVRERSVEGIALASGYAVGERLASQ